MAAGILKVYHRLNETAAYKFDGRDYTFAPHETQHLPAAVAQHFYDTSIFKYEPSEGVLYRALVLEHDPNFGKPYDDAMPMELLDRSVDPEPFVKRGIEDKPAKTVYQKVKGVEADMKGTGGKGVF